MDITFPLNEIQFAAKEILETARNKNVIAFHGGMGVGKTTLIKALCNELMVKDAVSSPTYSIINEYSGAPGKIFHIDLYRLSGVEEAVQAGVEDCLYSGDLCLVEWPERAVMLLPESTLHIYLYTVDEVNRRAKM